MIPARHKTAVALGFLMLFSYAGLTFMLADGATTVLGDGASLRATSVAPAFGYSCAMTDGSVSCWGSSFFGLGDGSTLQSSTPVDVVGLKGNVTSLASGGNHTCASTSPAGEAFCWGWGQRLGDGVNEHSAAPVRVFGLTGVVGLAGGSFHSCAVTGSGAVKCWGRNTHGELGDGNDGFSPVPVDVGALTEDIAAVTAGHTHTCALTTEGGVKCWGFNRNGQLGDGTEIDRREPTDIVGLGAGVTAIAAGGSATCALMQSGSLKCWGTNEYGLLGDGGTTNSNVPIDVAALAEDVQSVAVGGNHTCAITSSGTVKCWGLNDQGQLGDGSIVDRLTPVAVVGIGDGAQTISASGQRTCATAQDDTVLCWGYLTNGTSSANPVPTEVAVAEKTPSTPTAALIPPPTSTPAPTSLPGDVNCDGSVTSVDAALVLQFVSGLVDSLRCQSGADANSDENVNSIDAALMLQYSAGLLSVLPP